jgi:proteasome lid subunit RPN8/RPN11
MNLIKTKVIFTEDAFNTVLAETFHKDPDETGGILLGQIENDTWYVIECIEPGPGSVFRSAYFEYDHAFVNYLAKARARRYQVPLRLLGLWHRHPGSYDRFSPTDDGTNLLYAKLSDQGALSGLVNLDPDFRLTLYHFDEKLKYMKTDYSISSKDIPEKFLRKRYEKYYLPGPNLKNHEAK